MSSPCSSCEREGTLLAALLLPKIEHIGYLVEDLDASVAAYRRYYGVADFELYEYAPDEVWENDEPVKAWSLQIAKGHTHTGLPMELLSPGRGNSPHRRQLAAQGPGLHHIAYKVTGYAEWTAKMRREAGPALFEGIARDEIRGTRYSCFFRVPGLAEIVEITEHTR